jgi:SAM-dependent methyltransferase
VITTFEPPWERIARETRWGQYLTRAESRAFARGVSVATDHRVALDVGCEGGRWARLLVDDDWKVTCTDVHADVLDVCRTRLPSARCVLVTPECTQLPVESETVGLVLCLEVFQVVHEDWFLDEVDRVLAPGGVLVAVVSNRTSHRRWLWRFKRKDPDPRARLPMYSRSYRSWRRYLEDRGFVVDQEEGVGWMPFPRESNSRLVAPLTTLERLLGLRHLVTLSPWICVVIRREA